MKKISLLFLLFSIGQFTRAQNEVNGGLKDLSTKDVLTTKDLFQYESFKRGKVMFKDGTSSEALLNYSRFYGQLLFMNSKGDSLALGGPEQVNFVAIGTDTFYYAGRVALQLRANYNSIKLARHEFLRQLEKEVKGAYGSSTATSAVAKENQGYLVDGRLMRITPEEGTEFKSVTQLYIGDLYNQFVPLTKRTLADAFAKKAKEFKAYVKDNPVDYSSENDLRKLIAYMSSQ